MIQEKLKMREDRCLLASVDANGALFLFFVNGLRLGSFLI